MSIVLAAIDPSLQAVVPKNMSARCAQEFDGNVLIVVVGILANGTVGIDDFGG
jgi:hypothetical protein